MLCQVANCERVLVEAARESLVRHVNERQQFPLDDDFRNRAPVFIGRIEPRRIVAASVKQNGFTLWDRTQRSEHRINTDNMLFDVVVRIGF